MKTKRPVKTEPMALNDRAAFEAKNEPMVRTQIYLSKTEYDFLQAEGARRSLPMAAIIRELIDKSMTLPNSAWDKNPLLQSTPEDPGFAGRSDASVNHDHYIYGSPKKYSKSRGKWAPLPPVDEQ